MTRTNYLSLPVRKDVVVDIETLGTQDDSVILSIGAVFIDPTGTRDSVVSPDGTICAPSFYREIRQETQVGRSITADTRDWWMHNDRKAEFFRLCSSETRVHLAQALQDFYQWIVDNRTKDSKAWGNAPDFDMGILSHAAKSTGVAKMMKASTGFPIPYYNFMDVRTLKVAAFGGDTPDTHNCRHGMHHNALDDAVSEALIIQECMKRIHGG